MTTIKTIKLKRNPGAAPAVTPPDMEAHAAADSSEAGGEVTVEPTLAPPPVGSAPARGRSTFLLFALLSLGSLIALLVVIGLQTSEWMFYAANPSVWPIK